MSPEEIDKYRDGAGLIHIPFPHPDTGLPTCDECGHFKLMIEKKCPHLRWANTLRNVLIWNRANPLNQIP